MDCSNTCIVSVQTRDVCLRPGANIVIAFGTSTNENAQQLRRDHIIAGGRPEIAFEPLGTAVPRGRR